MDYAGSPFEIKQLSESGSIEGLLAGFGNVDGHGHVIDSKAFSRTLAERGGKPLPMLLHHDQLRPVGAWKEFQERDEGLYVKGSLSLQARDAQEAYALAKDGALTGLSIGYHTKQAQRDQLTGQTHLLDLELMEGSLVTIPSNPNTRVSAIKAITSAGDIADMLKEAGISVRKAKAAAGFAWKAINDQDDEAAAEAEIRSILNTSAARIAALGRN